MFVVDPDADEDGNASVELGRRGGEEECGGDETEQGETSSDGRAAIEAVTGSSANVEGGAGSQSASGALTISPVGNGRLAGKDVRTSAGQALGSTDDGSITTLLFDASTALAGGISPALRFGESDG